MNEGLRVLVYNIVVAKFSASSHQPTLILTGLICRMTFAVRLGETPENFTWFCTFLGRFVRTRTKYVHHYQC